MLAAQGGMKSRHTPCSFYALPDQCHVLSCPCSLFPLRQEELARRVNDAKVRQRLLETGGQQGEFNALKIFKRAGSGAKITHRLQRAPSLAERDRDFLGGKELLQPFELAEELRDRMHEQRGYEGQAVEAGNRHAAATDKVNGLRMRLEREGPGYQEALQEETAALRAEEAQRLALLDRALKVVDVSLGPHMVARKTSLEEERRGVVEEYRKKVDAAERDVREWHQGLEAEIKTIEAQIEDEYNAVYRFTELADATARQVDLVQRAKKAAEEREVVASETAEAQQRLVDCELRKHALHCEAAAQFLDERQELQGKLLHTEAEASNVRRRAQTCAHGSVARNELDSMVKEAKEAANDHGAGSGWNTVAPPGPKTLVRARNEPRTDQGDDGAGLAADDDGEHTVVTTFRNKEGAERGVDIMVEDLVAGESELSVMANGVVWSEREIGAAVSRGEDAADEGQDVGPVSPQDARKIVEAERERWRTMLPRPQLNVTAPLASATGVTGAGLDESRQSVEPAATAATPVAATPKPSKDMLSTHMSMLSSWSMTGLTDASGARDSIARSVGSTIQKDGDTISSPDGRATVLWVRDVFGGSLQDDVRLGGLPLPGQSSEDLQASACLRLVEARQAMGTMRKLAREVRSAGEKLLAIANERLEGGSGDVLSLVEAHRDAGRASALLGLAASVRLDGWLRAREAEKSAEESLRRADRLLNEMVGPEAAAMVGVGGAKRTAATGEQPLLPGSVVNAQSKLELRKEEGHGRFTSFLGVPLQVSSIVRSLLQIQAQREKEGDDPLTDERLLADRQLAFTGVRISQEQLAKMRTEWQAEQRLEQAIRRYMSGNLSREEYEKLVQAEGLSALPPSAVDSAIQLPVSCKGQTAPAPDPVSGLGGSWANICGRWHFIPPRPAAGLAWKPSHFLQLAEADFEVMRKSSLYALVSEPPYVDGFGRNKKQHWSIVAEDAERLREAENIQARVPAHVPASHGGSLPAGTRSNWQSALAAPWKSSAKINGSSSVRVGCDAPQATYDPTSDALKSIDKLPHGDHLKVGDKARAPWNSASFALGTAGNKTHWAGAEVTQGRGYERGKVAEDDVRRSVVYAIGEAFGLMPSASATAGQLPTARAARQEAPGDSDIKMDLSSMGLDDEYCFLITHALGHHPSGPVFAAPPADGVVQGKEEEDDLPEKLLPHPLSDETLRVTELRLAHNSIGDCGALELALALSDVPFTLLGAIPRGGEESGDDSGPASGQGGMLREVRRLDVSCNVIGNAGATALSDMLAVNRTLSELSLSDNQIAGAGVEALSGAIASNTHLQTLDLSNNLLQGDNLGSLAAVLSWNSVLLQQLPDAGAHVAVNQTLRCLLLRGNVLGDVGARFIAAALASHPTLEHVGLEDNEVGDVGADVLGHALRLRQSGGLAPLKFLSLANNAVTAHGLDRLLGRLRAGQGGQAAGGHILDVLELKGNAEIAPSATTSLAQSLKDVGIGRLVV
jgi:hypothetical protein